jgi:hypothetical protein
MDDHTGLLIGLGSRGTPHAAAWEPFDGEDGLVYDPCGEKYSKDKFQLREFWIAGR